MILFPFRYAWWFVSKLRRSLRKPPEFVLFLLEGDPPALPDPPRPRWQRLISKPRSSLKDLADPLDAVARDPHIKGVVLHLRPVPMPMATLQDLRELVSNLRAAGKRVVAWAPFYTTGTYYLACACDEILVLPGGMVQPLGFSATGVFLAQGLARFGLQGDFVQISPYKSAPDLFTKSKMSDEFRDQLRWLLESQHEELIAAICEGRKLDAKAARDLVDASPYTDDRAVEKGVVDSILSEEQLPAHLARGGTATLGGWEQARRRLWHPAPTLRIGSYIAIMRI